MTISRRFFETAMRLPNKVAVIHGDRQITYAWLLTLVQQQAHILRLNGLKRHDHLMCQLTGIDFVVMMLACADSGICLVPMGKDATQETIGKAYSACDCKFFINEGFEPKDEGVNGVRLKFQGQPEDRFLIITTSGSTGEPKPILLKQKTKLARVEMMNDLYYCTEDDVTLISTPLWHSMGQRLVLMSVLKGGALVLMDKWSAANWWGLAGKHNVTFAVPVASQVKQIGQMYDDPNSIRCIVSSSAPLSTEPMLLSRMRPIFNCYGTTEVSIATSTTSTTSRWSVGEPIDNSVVIVDEQGEILVGASGTGKSVLFDGYYNKPELTAAAMVSGFFKTGDLGEIDEWGDLFYLGRIKELINVGGTKVYPQDVEAVLADYPAIAECAAFSQADDVLGEVVALAIVLDPEAVKANLISFETFGWTRGIQSVCLPHLTDAQLPRAVYIVNALPKTETGKIQRGKLAETLGGAK